MNEKMANNIIRKWKSIRKTEKIDENKIVGKMFSFPVRL